MNLIRFFRLTAQKLLFSGLFLFLVGHIPYSFPSLRAGEVNAFVDTATQEYDQFTEIVEQIDRLDTTIKKALSKHDDPINLVTERSRVLDSFKTSLKKRGVSYTFQDGRRPLWYAHDDLWYHLFSKDSHATQSVDVHPVHGPCLNDVHSRTSRAYQTFKNPFLQIVSFHQIENICGFAALANAAALEAQLLSGNPITFVNTRQRAELCLLNHLAPLIGELPRRGDGSIEYSGQEMLSRAATRLGLDRKVEYVDLQTITNLHERFKKGEKVDRIDELEKKIALGNFHTIFNSGGDHWVLLSVVKNAHGALTMFLVDSLNVPLHKDNQTNHLIEFIDDLIVRVVLQKILDEQDIPTYKSLVQHHNVLCVEMLEELVKRYRPELLPDQKMILTEKIEAVTVLVDIQAMPQTVRNFLQASVNEYQGIFPEKFKRLIAVTSQKRSKDSNKQHSVISSKEGGLHFYVGFFVGCSVLAYIVWIKYKLNPKNRSVKDIGFLRSPQEEASQQELI